MLDDETDRAAPFVAARGEICLAATGNFFLGALRADARTGGSD